MRARVPASERLAARGRGVRRRCAVDLDKLPGVAETIDWAKALVRSAQQELEAGSSTPPWAPC